jgi:hypothetical protein
MIISAAAAAGFADKLIESKGLDYLDKEKAKHDGRTDLYHSTEILNLTVLKRYTAKKRAEQALNDSGEY